MTTPRSLARGISPPRSKKRAFTAEAPAGHHGSHNRSAKAARNIGGTEADQSLPAAIEAGLVKLQGHLEYFAAEFARRHRQTSCSSPRDSTNTQRHDQARLSIKGFEELYRRNLYPGGRHFVVHQHDHPRAGVHYDLRIQFSETSCISFAIPYGLPGDPNSRRPHRLAIETRVHNLWNNLIESASYRTGSLLIWDTGEYEVLHKHARRGPGYSTDNDDDNDQSKSIDTALSDSDRLRQGFKKRSIKLRLHGSRLPMGYTISLHLPSQTVTSLGRRPRSKSSHSGKGERGPANRHRALPQDTESEDSELPGRGVAAQVEPANLDTATASDDEDEDMSIKDKNAYPGASNTIGSVHQRGWIVTLDRQACGFVKHREPGGKPCWIQPEGQGSRFEKFNVLGRDVERSVVTGRLAADVCADEGVKDYVGRQGWRPITD